MKTVRVVAAIIKHTLPIMNFKLELEHEVRNDIYDYFMQ